MKAVRKLSFSRRRKPVNQDNLVPKPKQSETLHPYIHSNLEKDLYDKSLSHNEVAYEMYGLNAILNFPDPNEDDEIPDNLKKYIGHNISVPNGSDGNNLKGIILGIKNINLELTGEIEEKYDQILPFYIVLFQANEDHRQAVVKLVYIEKTGIKVLGIVTEYEMMKKIEEANAALAAASHSEKAKILQLKAAYDAEKKRKGKKSSVSVNFAKESMGHDYADLMIRPGRACLLYTSPSPRDP